MAEASLRKIKSVSARPGYLLLVTWDRGGTAQIDMSDMVGRGGVFAPLLNEDLFGAVRIGEFSRVIEWPEPADDDGDPVIAIDADALFARARDQENSTLTVATRKLFDTMRRVRRVPGGPSART